MPSTIAATDVFVLAGSFKADAWTPDKSTVVLAKKADGTYSVDVPLADFTTSLDFKVVRNPKNGADGWKFVEKDATCMELADNRKVTATDGGKEIKIDVLNFRNTGTCPD